MQLNLISINQISLYKGLLNEITRNTTIYVNKTRFENWCRKMQWRSIRVIFLSSAMRYTKKGR